MLCFDLFIALFFYLLYLWVCQWLTSTYYTMGLPGLYWNFKTGQKGYLRRGLSSFYLDILCKFCYACLSKYPTRHNSRRTRGFLFKTRSNSLFVSAEWRPIGHTLNVSHKGKMPFLVGPYQIILFTKRSAADRQEYYSWLTSHPKVWF